MDLSPFKFFVSKENGEILCSSAGSQLWKAGSSPLPMPSNVDKPKLPIKGDFHSQFLSYLTAMVNASEEHSFEF